MIYMKTILDLERKTRMLYQWQKDALKFDIKITISKIIMKEIIKTTPQL